MRVREVKEECGGWEGSGLIPPSREKKKNQGNVLSFVCADRSGRDTQRRMMRSCCDDVLKTNATRLSK